MIFLDTYAIIEIIEGNPNYDKYGSEEAATSILNLYELYYKLLHKHGKEVADFYYKKFNTVSLPIEIKHIEKACEIKAKMKVSYADAMGYAMAKIEGIKFLTGDQAFKDAKGVEFTK